MPSTRSGRQINSRAQPRFRQGDAAPFGTPTWRSYHLSEGVKIALDYLNLPPPPLGEAYSQRNGVSKRNRRTARRYAKSARDWAKIWYKISRGTAESAAATPGLNNPAAVPGLPAAWEPSWTEIRNDNAQIQPQRDMSVLYPRIWTLSAGVTPDRRAQTTSVAAMAALGGARTFFDYGIRLTCRNPHTGRPRNWFQGLSAAEQTSIAATATAHTVTGGHPMIVDYNTLTVPPPIWMPGAHVPGCFLERLPEFLCQLGGKTTQNMFL